MMEGFLKEWLGIILSMIALGTVLSGWFTAGGKKAMTALDAYKIEVNTAFSKAGSDYVALDRRVQKLEDALPHMPTREDFHEIQLSLTRVEERMASMAKEYNTQAAVVGRIENYLRTKEPGK
jgi:hypothetical protein